MYRKVFVLLLGLGRAVGLVEEIPEEEERRRDRELIG